MNLIIIFVIVILVLIYLSAYHLAKLRIMKKHIFLIEDYNRAIRLVNQDRKDDITLIGIDVATNNRLNNYITLLNHDKYYYYNMLRRTYLEKIIAYSDINYLEITERISFEIDKSDYIIKLINEDLNHKLGNYDIRVNKDYYRMDNFENKWCSNNNELSKLKKRGKKNE